MKGVWEPIGDPWTPTDNSEQTRENHKHLQRSCCTLEQTVAPQNLKTAGIRSNAIKNKKKMTPAQK